ncbi:MAG: GNAT family N-acetyltransferase [Candidatus Heimdallarchaeaceae archaeon]
MKDLSSLTYIIGDRKDIPEKYQDVVISMIRDFDSERSPFEPHSMEFYRNYWKQPRPAERKTISVYAFNKSKELVGFGHSFWNIEYDNLDHGSYQIYVVTGERRKGYGTDIMRKLFTVIPPQIMTLVASALGGSIGELFLQKFQKESCYDEFFRAADLSEFSIDEIKAINTKEEQRISDLGYKFVELESFDYATKFDEERYVRMVERIWNDMPREEMSFGEDVITPNRYRSLIDYNLKKGDRNFGYAIAVKETNEPVGHTRVLYNKHRPSLVEQDDTGVVHEHRGNGFGLALKYKVLEKLLIELDAKHWYTGNAISNEHMIKINEKLKHKIVGKKIFYELKRNEWEKI